MLQGTSPPGSTSPRRKVRNGLSTSSATHGWLPTLRSTSKKYRVSIVLRASLRTNDPAAECYRDSSSCVANIPVRHREDAWAEHPNPGSWRCTQSDRTTATGAAQTAATGSCRGCPMNQNLVTYLCFVVVTKSGIRYCFGHVIFDTRKDVACAPNVEGIDPPTMSSRTRSSFYDLFM